MFFLFSLFGGTRVEITHLNGKYTRFYTSCYCTLAVPSLLFYCDPLRSGAFADSFILLHGRLPLRFSNCQGSLQVVDQLVYLVEFFSYADLARCYVVAILFAMAARHWEVVGLTLTRNIHLA